MIPRSEASLAEILSVLGLKDSGLREAEVLSLPLFSGIEDIGAAKPTEIVFVGSDKYLERTLDSRAKLFIVDKSLMEKANGIARTGKAFLFVANFKLAMAKISQFFGEREWLPEAGVGPGAVVAPSVKLGRGVRLAANVVLGPGVELADGVEIMSGAVLGANVKVGAASRIYPNVVIYDRVEIGARVRIHANTTIGADGFGYAQEKRAGGVDHVKLIHNGSVLIGDDVEIGANSSVDRGTIGNTVIGRGTKIDNQVQIGHNCQIGEGTIICGNCGIAGSTKIGRFVILAGFCGVGNGTDIGDGAIIGAMSGVQGRVAPGAILAGNPAREKNLHYRIQGAMGSLPEMFKFWKKMQKEQHL